MGMQFSAREQFSSVNLLKDMTLFKTGSGRMLFNIIKEPGEDLEEQIQIFDYRFIIHTGNSAAVFLQTVFQVKSKELDLPHFRIRPKNLMQRWGSRLGMYQKKLLIDDPVFNKYFLIRTKEPERLKQILVPELIEMLKSNRKLWVEGINYFLAIYRIGRRFKPQQIPGFRAKGHEFLHRLKIQSKKGPPY